MRKIIVAIALLVSNASIAQLIPYSSIIYQADSTGSLLYGRFFVPSPVTDSYFLMYDGNISQPKVGQIGAGLSWNGTSLSSDVTTAALSGYATTSQLTTGLNAKFNTPLGTASQYVRGDGTLASFPIASAPSQGSVTRSLNTVFQPSSTRWTWAGYRQHFRRPKL